MLVVVIPDDFYDTTPEDLQRNATIEREKKKEKELTYLYSCHSRSSSFISVRKPS